MDPTESELEWLTIGELVPLEPAEDTVDDLPVDTADDVPEVRNRRVEVTVR